jgi:hypothetical protein
MTIYFLILERITEVARTAMNWLLPQAQSSAKLCFLFHLQIYASHPNKQVMDSQRLLL